MSKPRGVRWLEEETGQALVRPTVSGEDGRHLSLRVTASLFARLDELAAERGETVSQVARRLLADGIRRHTDPERAAIDTAIAALESVRRDLG